MVSNGIRVTPSFVKIGRQIRNLKAGNTNTLFFIYNKKWDETANSYGTYWVTNLN